jgi:outer membrane protein OmpA-like peptidoglycan-associated protein
MRVAALGVLAAALGAGCAPLTERVVLLPAGDDGRLGAVIVKGARGEIVLAEPYAQADVLDGQPLRLKSDAQTVRQHYGGLIALQPQRPQRFVLRFGADGETPTPESMQLLERLPQRLASTPGAELVVIGHTDRVGPLEANDLRSLQRAQAVRDRLVAAGAAAERIGVAGRGEREPEVATEDGVAEPRNHRVEIWLR